MDCGDWEKCFGLSWLESYWVTGLGEFYVKVVVMGFFIECRVIVYYRNRIVVIFIDVVVVKFINLYVVRYWIIKFYGKVDVE